MRPEHRRAPGFNEKTFIFRNCAGFYTNFNVTARYNRFILKANLSNALSSLISKNLWLAYNFYKVNSTEADAKREEYELRYVKLISFDSVVEYRVISSFDEVTLETINEFNNKIGEQKSPLWKICVFQTADAQYVCAYFCHSLADGGTALQFHKDLAVELALFEDAETEIQVLFKYHSKLPEVKAPVETLTPLFYPKAFQRLWLWLKAKFPYISRWIDRASSYFRDVNQTPVFSSVPVDKDLRSKFKIVNFSPSQVTKITQYCRSNGITLTPFFNILGLNSIEKAIYPHYPRPTGSVEYSSSNFIAINGRRYYERLSKPFVYGTLVCGAPTVFRPINLESDLDLLRAMKEFHGIIQSELGTKRSFKLVWLNLIIDFPQVLSNKIGKLERYTTMISNLGKVADDPKLRWKVIDAWFGLNTSVGYHFILNLVTTETGGLNLVIPYNPIYDEIEAVVGEKTIPAMDYFVRLLRDTTEGLIK